MPDNAMHDFIQVIRQRGLVKKAESFCASWQTGYLAQDPNGSVYIYNAAISLTNDNWFFTERNDGHKFQRVSHLSAAAHWQGWCLPAQAVLQPQPDLNEEQRAFLLALDQIGASVQIRRFLDAWQHNCWLALDPDGCVHIFNNRPEVSSNEWINGAFDITYSWAKIDAIGEHHLDWTRCLVQLSMLRPPPVPLAPVEINSDSRMDCWI